jgi:hypothetical protein
METFNKYDFIIDLENEILSEIRKGNVHNNNSLQEFIENEIDTATIYYEDCWEICKQLSSSQFTDYGNDIKSISQLATIVLTDHVYNNIIFDYDVIVCNGNN